jgi:hypothetical protein
MVEAAGGCRGKSAAAFAIWCKPGCEANIIDIPSQSLVQ